MGMDAYQNYADNLMRRLQNYVNCIQEEAIRRFGGNNQFRRNFQADANEFLIFLIDSLSMPVINHV